MIKANWPGSPSPPFERKRNRGGRGEKGREFSQLRASFLFAHSYFTREKGGGEKRGGKKVNQAQLYCLLQRGGGK